MRCKYGKHICLKVAIHNSVFYSKLYHQNIKEWTLWTHTQNTYTESTVHSEMCSTCYRLVILYHSILYHCHIRSPSKRLWTDTRFKNTNAPVTCRTVSCTNTVLPALVNVSEADQRHSLECCFISKCCGCANTLQNTDCDHISPSLNLRWHYFIKTQQFWTRKINIKSK